jgi:hypothetical protein
MLEKVRDTVLVSVLYSRTHIDPKSERYVADRICVSLDFVAHAIIESAKGNSWIRFEIAPVLWPRRRRATRRGSYDTSHQQDGQR